FCSIGFYYPADPPVPHSFPTRRSSDLAGEIAPALVLVVLEPHRGAADVGEAADVLAVRQPAGDLEDRLFAHSVDEDVGRAVDQRSEEHTSELQSPYDLVCRLLLEKKKT